MDTYFATPQRSDNYELLQQIKNATHNPVIDGVMSLAGGLIAVLNQNRQIIAVNHKFLEALGVDNVDKITGMRPGEALDCIHASESPSGCGTGPHCVTCGVAVAIISTLGTQGPVDKTCSITVERHEKQFDLFFNVHASTIRFEGARFVLVFLEDITNQQYRAALERTFFHDISNTISGMVHASELLAMTPSHEVGPLASHIASLSNRLSKDVSLQRLLGNQNDCDISLYEEPLAVDAILKEMQAAVAHHPSKKAHRLKITNRAPGTVIHTDLSLLMRVLSNMLINAFEAEDDDHEIQLEVVAKGEEVLFSVWNKSHISPSVSRRIFQRNFSTKVEPGRGIGTFSMKLIGEDILGGRVSFESAPKQGTRFYLSLPMHLKSNGSAM